MLLDTAQVNEYGVLEAYSTSKSNADATQLVGNHIPLFTAKFFVNTIDPNIYSDVITLTIKTMTDIGSVDFATNVTGIIVDRTGYTSQGSLEVIEVN